MASGGDRLAPPAVSSFNPFAPGIFRLFLATLVVIDHFTALALGRFGVFVFFMLSGYWIARIYCEKYAGKPRSYLVFALSRFARLFPVYALCTGLMLLVELAMADASRVAALQAMLSEPQNVLRLALMVSSSTFQGILLSPAWSIDIEMQFYLAVPWLLWVALRGFKQGAIALALILALVCTLHYAWGPMPQSGICLITYLQFFLVGVLIYLTQWQPRRGTGLLSLGLVLGCVLMFTLVPALRGYLYLGSHWQAAQAGLNEPLNACFALVAIPYVAFNVAERGDRRDAHCGNSSYVIYMFHWIVAFVYTSRLGSLTHVQRIPLLAAALATVLAGSLLIYFAFDRPLERWRHAYLKQIGFY